MRCSLKIIWVALLILGVHLTALPAFRRARRIVFHHASVIRWKTCKDQPAKNTQGEPFAWMRIQNANIDTLVINGTEKKELSTSPGKTQLGNATVIMAHRDTHFRGLKNSSEGDLITLELREGAKRTYQIVDHIIIDASKAEQILQEFSNTDRLILLTCYPFRYTGPAPSRILFLADPI